MTSELLEVAVPSVEALDRAISDYAPAFEVVDRSIDFAVLHRKKTNWLLAICNLLLAFGAAEPIAQNTTDQLQKIDRSVQRIKILVSA
jgi:hypothetical protein